MGGAFLESPSWPISTIAILVSHEAAEDFVRGDPLVRMGKAPDVEIREWANILRPNLSSP
jgi:uncharacterized protein YciI